MAEKTELRFESSLRVPCTLSTDGIEGAKPRKLVMYTKINGVPDSRQTNSLITADIPGAQPNTTVESVITKLHPPPPPEIERSKPSTNIGRFPGLYDRKSCGLGEVDRTKHSKSLVTTRVTNPLTPDYQIKPMPAEKFAPLPEPKFIRDSIAIDDIPGAHSSGWRHMQYTMKQRDTMNVRDILGDMTGMIHRGTKHIPKWARESNDPTAGRAAMRDPLYIGDINGACSRPTVGTKYVTSTQLQIIAVRRNDERRGIIDQALSSSLHFSKKSMEERLKSVASPVKPPSPFEPQQPTQPRPFTAVNVSQSQKPPQPKPQPGAAHSNAASVPKLNFSFPLERREPATQKNANSDYISSNNDQQNVENKTPQPDSNIVRPSTTAGMINALRGQRRPESAPAGGSNLDGAITRGALAVKPMTAATSMRPNAQLESWTSTTNPAQHYFTATSPLIPPPQATTSNPSNLTINIPATTSK